MLLALTIIVTVFIVLGFGGVENSIGNEVFRAADEYNDFFYETTVLEAERDFNSTYNAPEFDAFRQVNRQNFNIYEEVSFVYHNKLSSGAGTVGNLTETILAPRFNIRYKIDNTTIYSREKFPPDQANALITSRELVLTETVNNTGLIGPNITEVIIWI